MKSSSQNASTYSALNSLRLMWGPPSRITDRLWQGGAPMDLKQIFTAGVDVLVLCAEECQLEGASVPNRLRVIEAPMDDTANGPSENEVLIAANAANSVLAALRAGKRVLTTCAAGRNRSGLVNALVLIGYYGISGREAVARIQEKRPNGLTNDSFVAFLNKIPPGGKVRVI